MLSGLMTRSTKFSVNSRPLGSFRSEERRASAADDAAFPLASNSQLSTSEIASLERAVREALRTIFL